MSLRHRHVLKFLGAIAGMCGLMAATAGTASAFSLIELFVPLTITKTCAGLSGTATLTLSVTRNNDNLGSSFTKQVQCGGSVIVTSVPNGDQPFGFAAGDMITITENSRPNLALLPANTTTVTLHAVTEANQTPNTVTIVDPAAVSIKKSCASGVTGKASFTVNNDSEQAQFSIDVACGATTALPLPQGWDASEDLLIHESTTPTNGVAANDVTVRIPESNGSAQVAEFVNAAAVATASPTPTVVPQLAQTGDREGTPLMLFLGVAAGSALLILGGLTVWRRRQA